MGKFIIEYYNNHACTCSSHTNSQSLNSKTRQLSRFCNSKVSEVRMSDSMLMIATGWLKLKYPTGQNAISRQPCEIFTPKFLDLYGRDPATILKLKKIFSFSPKLWLYKYSMPYFQFCRQSSSSSSIYWLKNTTT